MRPVLYVSEQPDGGFIQLISEQSEFEIKVCNSFSDLSFSIFKTKPIAVVFDDDWRETDIKELKQEIIARPELNHLKIFVLSSSDNPNKEVNAFHSGADEFLRKPVSKDAILIRLQVRCGKESAARQNKTTKSASRINIDLDAFSVYVDQKLIYVTRKEFELLNLLASQPEKVFTREEIYNKVWHRKLDENDRTIDVHVRRLRQKLGLSAILTQKGIGYRFVNR